MSVRRLVQRLLIVVVVALVILLTPLWLLRAAGDGLVSNGLREFQICGEKRTSEAADPFMNPLANDIMDATQGSQKGIWGVQRSEDCDVYQHYPPNLD
jgi:hypothetical protein